MSQRAFYHWWDEPHRSERTINAGALDSLFRNKAQAFRAANLRELLVGKLELKQRDYARCWRIATGRQHSTRTTNLIRLCDRLKVDYAELERRKVLADRVWPIDLSRPEFTMLKSHILNEGTLHSAVVKALYRPTGKVSLSAATTAYFYNNDPLLHRHIRWLARRCGSGVTTTRSKIGFTTTLDGTTSRILHRIGVPYGRRAACRIKLDPNLVSDDGLWKYHFCSTLIEEGFCSLRLAASRRLALEIGYFRGTDITQVFPASKRRGLPTGRRTLIGDLSEQDQQVVQENPPLLMVQEIDRLRRVHSRDVEPGLWPEAHPYEVRRCLDGTRMIAGWRFVTSRRRLVEVLSGYLRLSVPSAKRRHMLQTYEAYREHGSRRISPGDWLQLRRRIRRPYTLKPV